MAHILCVRPDGLLAIVEVESSASQFNEAGILPNELLDAFRETCFAGITWLAAAKATASIDSLPAPFGFWRNFGRRYFSAVCREYAQAHKVWRTPHSPDDESLDELLQSAPPMRGLEYASAESIRSLWRGLDEYTHEASNRGCTCPQENLDSQARKQAMKRPSGPSGRMTAHAAREEKRLVRR